MKTLLQLLSVVGVAAALSGCAAPARIDQMTSSLSPEKRLLKSDYRNNIAVVDVTGGKATNPMWVSNVGNSEFEQALEASLREAGLLAVGKQAGTHKLIAHMERVDQPMFGASMTVTVSVRYTLVERATGKEVYNRSVSLPYTAPFNAAFIGTERLRIANEGAVRVNIAKLIDDLIAMGTSNVAVSQ